MSKKTTNDPQPDAIAVSSNPKKILYAVAATTGRSFYELGSFYDQAPEEIQQAFLDEKDHHKAVTILSNHFATDKKASIE